MLLTGYNTNMKARVEATLIFVTDVEASRAWYQDVFGMTVGEYNPPNFQEMVLDGQSFYLESMNDKWAEGFRTPRIGGRHTCVFQVDDIRAAVDECKAKGVRVVVEPVQQFWGGWNAVIADPDGNEFVLDQDTV